MILLQKARMRTIHIAHLEADVVVAYFQTTGIIAALFDIEEVEVSDGMAQLKIYETECKLASGSFDHLMVCNKPPYTAHPLEHYDSLLQCVRNVCHKLCHNQCATRCHS